jgi:ABC-2 type transport system ATP-binding protein
VVFCYDEIVDTSVNIKNLSVVLGGNVKALTKINLDLPLGKMVGFIGPSGAGKTTLIRCIVGRLRPTSGEITVFNYPAGSSNLRRMMSYMTQELSVYPDLSVRENLKYFVTISGLPRRQSKDVISQILDAVDMAPKAESLVGHLSSGQKQRVSLAIALIGSPKLMVLDEPTVGLDPVLRQKLWELFARLAAQGTTLIISSHSMDEAQRCDDLVLIRGGKLIAHDSPEALRAKTGTKTIEESFLKLVEGKE